MTIEQKYKKFEALAEAEGWGVVYTSIQDPTHSIYELQRMDEMSVFENDDAAHAHVVAAAEKDPNGFHADAIRFLVEYSPNEIDSIIRSSVGSVRLERLLNTLNLKL